MTVILRNTAPDAFADRVLELNRATAAVGNLAHHAALLSSRYRATFAGDDDVDLGEAVARLLDAARDQWLKGADTGLDHREADHYRGKAIERARGLAEHAEAAREAAEALALILEGAEPFDTVEHLEWLITGARNNHTDGDRSYDLAELWLRLAQAHHSPAIDEAGADRLRCEFDRVLASLGGLDDTAGLGAEVHIWRDDYLKYRADWDTHGTWAYAADTARTWPELRRYWDALDGIAQRDQLDSPGEAFDVRDRILTRADALAAAFPASETDPDRAALAEAAAHYNTDQAPLMARIRAAETMAALWRIDGVVDNLEGDTLTLEAAIARKFDRLKHTAPDAHDTDAWGAASQLEKKIIRWRHLLHTAALSATDHNNDPEYTYLIVYAAIADARLWPDAETHVRELLGAVDVLASRGQITDDHAARLRAMANTENTREATSQ